MKKIMICMFAVLLMVAFMSVGAFADGEAELYSIPGNVPNPINMPNHCYFKDRCEQCVAKCNGKYPHEIYVSPTHMVAC